MSAVNLAPGSYDATFQPGGYVSLSTLATWTTVINMGASEAGYVPFVQASNPGAGIWTVSLSTYDGSTRKIIAERVRVTAAGKTGNTVNLIPNAAPLYLAESEDLQARVDSYSSGDAAALNVFAPWSKMVTAV